jgi:hypothetical protein
MSCVIDSSGAPLPYVGGHRFSRELGRDGVWSRMPNHDPCWIEPCHCRRPVSGYLFPLWRRRGGLRWTVLGRLLYAFYGLSGASIFATASRVRRPPRSRPRESN